MQLKRNRYLHSKEHLLADDLSRVMREPKRFAAYLGIAKLYYESDLRRLARYVTEKKDLPIEARGKYFFGALRRLPKKPGVKFKRRTKRKSRYRLRKAQAISRILDFVPPTRSETKSGRTNGKYISRRKRTK